MRGSEALREALRPRSFPAEPREDAARVARIVLRIGGESVLGIVFFGSRKTRAGPDPWSAYDLFVLTRDYPGFYRALRSAGALRRSAGLAALLNAWMPPNQLSLGVEGQPGRVLAKCAVITLERLLRETSPRRTDHFCLGRLFQPAEVLYARDAATAERILDALVGAHALTYAWIRPWLPERFDVEAYCRTLLRISLRREIRPEPGGRADALWEAQQEDLRPVYSILLENLAGSGELVAHEGGSFSLARAASAWERARLVWYFRWSLVRATARWLKYVLTFEDWLEYLVRKAERHSGETIVLTARERRLPLLFIWPRMIRYLRHKDR